jgi:hypothetical protein
MDHSHHGTMTLRRRALRMTRHLLEWLRDLVWPSFSCRLLQCGEVDISTRDDQPGENEGVYTRVRVTNRSAEPGAVQAVQVYEKRKTPWKIEAFMLLPQREEVLLPLALAPAQVCEVGLRALSPRSGPGRQQRRGARLTLRLQDHRGRLYRLTVRRGKIPMPQFMFRPTPSL